MPDYRRIGMTVAQKYGIPWNIFNATVNAESSWRPDARSPSGAIGFTQLMPGTAAGLGVNPNDPIQNLEGGARYLSQQFSRFKDWKLALAAYNAGPSAVDRAGGMPEFPETRAYVAKIIAMAHGGMKVTPTTTPTPMPSPTELPTPSRKMPKIDLQKILDAAAPSARSIGILQDLGGIAARVAQSAQAPIPVPKQIAELPMLRGGSIPLITDHEEPLPLGVGTIVQAATKYLGTPYKWGGAKPGGFDCSGFIQYLYAQRGIPLPRTTYDQVKAGVAVDREHLRPGDIVFFSDHGDVHHEGLYIGNGQFMHAPHTGDVVKISSLKESYYRNQFLTGRRVTE